MARFERSTLPDHEGKRIVVLRFLKIITPVKCVIPLYDGYIVPPKEGDLLRRFYRKVIDKLHPPAWSFDIDKLKDNSSPNGQRNKNLRGLRFLWDT